MKILHVFKKYFTDGYGGIELIIHNLAEGVRRFGHEADVFTLAASANPPLVQRANHRVHRSRRLMEFRSTDLSLSAFRDFPRIAAEFDIIHYHFPWPFMDLLHFYARPTKPTLVSYQSDIVKQKLLYKVYKSIQKRFLNSVDSIVASSAAYFDSSFVLGSFRDKVSIIPLGLEEDCVTDSTRVECWRSRLGEDFFLFIGALRYYKGIEYLLKAAHRSRHPVVIAGGGGEERRFRRMAAELGPDHVVFLGEVSHEDKKALLTLCRALVFPSHLRSEAFGLTLVEGLMFGKPLISCEIGTGTSFVNLDGVTGLVVPPEDPAALAGAMDRLAADAHLAEKMGAAGRKRFLECFTAEMMTKKYVEIYEKLGQKRAK